MVHNILETCEIHSAKLTNVNLAAVASALLQLLVLLKAALAEELFQANVALVYGSFFVLFSMIHQMALGCE